MNRKDYRKLMEQKKRNKAYAKGIILTSLGLGIGLANSTTTQAESREWTANTSTTIKKGDTEYRILWGDTLSLISKDSGLTIGTLTKLNNILDANLIYEGNILTFGNGATATVKDANGNVIAETPLTTEDKAGITEAQNNATNNVNSNNANGSSSAKTNKTATNTNNSKSNNGIINTNSDGKNNNSSTNNNGGINTTKPVNPTKPTDPVPPVKPPIVDPESPNEEKINVTRAYFDVDTEELMYSDTIKIALNKEGKGIIKADNIPNGYELAEGETGVREISKAQNTASFKVKKIKDVIPPIQQEYSITINHVTQETGEILSSETKTAKEGTTVNAHALNFEDRGYELVGSETQSVIADANKTITFTYKKIDDENPYIPVHTSETITVNVDIDGNSLTSTTGYNYVSESTDEGVTTTATNGDSHTIYTKTVVWEKDAPIISENPYIGEYKKVIRGEYQGTFYEELGNSGMVWADQLTASLWAIEEIGFNTGSYLVWQVRVADTNEIMWTAHLL